MLKSKKAQTGETVSWIVATLVIIGILLIFIYVSVLMSNTKKINFTDTATGLPSESAILTEKNFIANEIMNNKNKDMIDGILKNENP